MCLTDKGQGARLKATVTEFGPVLISKEKKNVTLDKEIEELQKAEKKREASREKELARLRKEQARAEKLKEKENDKVWRDLNKAATRKTKDNSLFGVLARGILGVLGVK